MGIMDNLKNIGIGGMTGLVDSIQDKGWYIPQFQYAGNGLAKNSMQYFANPDYRDYTSGGRALNSLFSGQGSGSGDTIDSLKNRLSTMLQKPMFSNLLDRNKQASFPLKTETIQLPQVGSIGGGTIGDYGNAYNSFYDYGLPTQQSYSRPDWLK